MSDIFKDGMDLLSQLKGVYIKLGGKKSDIPPEKLNDLEYIIDKIEDRVSSGGGGGGSVNTLTLYLDRESGKLYFDPDHTSLFIDTNIEYATYNEAVNAGNDCFDFLSNYHLIICEQIGMIKGYHYVTGIEIADDYENEHPYSLAINFGEDQYYLVFYDIK